MLNEERQCKTTPYNSSSCTYDTFYQAPQACVTGLLAAAGFLVSQAASTRTLPVWRVADVECIGTAVVQLDDGVPSKLRGRDNLLTA